MAECERGYQRSIYEFDNEISCRDTIEETLGDSEELDEFRRRVEAADENFRRLALADQFRRGEGIAWWHRVIVKRAGQELASDLRSEYGASVSVIAGGKLP